MRRIAILTDSNAGFAESEARDLGITIVPMPFFINGELCFEGSSLSQEEFYTKLEDEVDISTTQPAPGDLMDIWDKVLKDNDEIVYIPMSSGLSASCFSAISFAKEYDGRVQVVNNQRISVTQRRSVLDALALSKAGRSAAEIREILEREKLQSSIYITVDTLKYLKKGGRVTPAAAAIGTVLSIKPVLQIQGEKLDSYAKVRGKKAAKKTMITAVRKDIETRFADVAAAGQLAMDVAYTGNYEEALEWKSELSAAFPGYDIHMAPLSLSVACHIGRGALAVGLSKIVEV